MAPVGGIVLNQKVRFITIKCRGLLWWIDDEDEPGLVRACAMSALAVACDWLKMTSPTKTLFLALNGITSSFSPLAGIAGQQQTLGTFARTERKRKGVCLARSVLIVFFFSSTKVKYSLSEILEVIAPTASAFCLVAKLFEEAFKFAYRSFWITQI